MAEAVSLGELVREEALFGLTGVRKVGVPRGRSFSSGLCLSYASSLGVSRPFTNKVERVEKYTQTMGGARSIALYDDACTISSASYPGPHITVFRRLETHVLNRLTLSSHRTAGKGSRGTWKRSPLTWMSWPC